MAISTPRPHVDTNAPVRQSLENADVYCAKRARNLVRSVGFLRSVEAIGDLDFGIREGSLRRG